MRITFLIVINGRSWDIACTMNLDGSAVWTNWCLNNVRYGIDPEKYHFIRRKYVMFLLTHEKYCHMKQNTILGFVFGYNLQLWKVYPSNLSLEILAVPGASYWGNQSVIIKKLFSNQNACLHSPLVLTIYVSSMIHLCIWFVLRFCPEMGFDTTKSTRYYEMKHESIAS